MSLGSSPGAGRIGVISGSATRCPAWVPLLPAAAARACRRVVPKPGTGPSEATRERGYYNIETYTTTTTAARYVARMSQDGDPGYKATSVLLGECGLALATLTVIELSELRGVLTIFLRPRWVMRC